MTNQSPQRDRKLKSKQKLSWSGIEIFSLIMFICYLFTEFIRNDKKFIDNMHPQWLYLAGLNIVVFVVMWNKMGSFYSTLNEILKNLITIIYLIFLVLLAVSIFQAINVFQGFESLSRNITTFFVFINFCLLLYQIKERIHVLAKIMVLILLYHSIHVLYQFISKSGPINLDAEILSIVGGFGNKNITSVGLLIKVPFVLYLIDYYRKGIWNIVGLMVFALAVFDILLLNARASFIGLGLVVLTAIVFGFVSYFKVEKERVILVNLSKIVGIIIFVVFVNILYFNQLKKSNEVVVGGYGTVTERLATIKVSQNSARTMIWGWTYDLFKDNLALGCGAGNYQIAILKYENSTRSNWAISKHSHNDFLEIASETGIFGLLAYSLIYLFFFINFIRIIIRKVDIRLKTLTVSMFMGMTIYFVDAFFNFPHERPPVQIFFALILAFIVVMSTISKNQEYKSINKNSFKKALIFLIVIMAGSIYINAIVVKSSVAQKSARLVLSVDKQELAPKYRNFTADKINSEFPDYPTINDGGMPIVCTKAELLVREKKYNEALKILKSSKAANPYHLGDDKLRFDIFKATLQYDSALYYANRLINCLPNMYESYLNIGIMEYERGNIEIAKKHFERAISLNSNDYISHENLGVILYNSKNYPLAIEHLTKVIDSKTSNTGKAELIRGWCYFYSGDKEKACADYKRSVVKKNAIAIQYLEGCK